MDDFGTDPAQAQAVMAELLRRRQQSGAALQDNNLQGHFLDNMAAIAQMANNPGAASAAAAAAKSRQAQFKPDKLGITGFALPGTGQYADSPMYVEDRQAQRENARVLAKSAAARAHDANQTRKDIAAGHDAVARERIQAMGTNKANGKNLPGPDVRNLTKLQGSAIDFSNVADSFDDAYAGPALLTGAQNALGKANLPYHIGEKYQGQSNWWQNYNDWKNLKRNTLFGSALTVNEARSFDQANITEGMRPEMIRTRLAQQKAAVQRAYNILKSNYGKAGYNMSKFEDMGDEERPMGPVPGSTSADEETGEGDASGTEEDDGGFRIIQSRPKGK